LGLGGLINLLTDSDKDIRIAAVRALKGYNDIGALKFIIDNFEREKDPEVREAYRENFWVIKEREGSR
jgi:HEAT repeat protein